MTVSDAVVVLEYLRLVVFAGAAVAGLRLWLSSRSRPAALLAAAFGVLATILLTSQLLPEPASTSSAAVELARDIVVIGLAAFPWLLAAFAWSFGPRVPRWLTWAGGVVVAVAVWTLVMPPLPQDRAAWGAVQNLFLVVFIGGWSALTVAAAVKLWRSGGTQPLGRARMRSMAVGALVLTMALLAAGAQATERSAGQAIIHALVIVSALLFTAGFAPPRVLRLWWRRRATGQWQRMQAHLVAALTPTDVAGAVVPLLAEVLGAGAAVLTSDGTVLASAGLSSGDLDRLTSKVDTRRVPSDADHWVALNSSWLVVTETPYTPLFGADERDIIAGHALQLRLALERAELFTANEAARQALEREQQATQAMLTGLAHDLRSPLAAVGGFTHHLRDDLDPAERDGMLNRIHANLDHLFRLIDAVVELARAGQTYTDRVAVDLNDTVAGVAERLRQRHPHLTVDRDGLPTVLANPLAMDQVFDNLLSNAIKYADRDDVHVAVRSHLDEEGPGIAIDVIDNGPGIPPDEREDVFTPFRRGRHASGDGSGIGLGLVRRILAGHGGDITLLEGVQGAHFRIRLNGDTPPQEGTIGP